MSEAAVVGRGPITLITSAGQQISIPLTALYFDSSGALKASRWPLYATYQTDLDPWLSYLSKTGELTAAPQPPPATAMVITAADPGPPGNNIQVTFSNITPDPTDPNNPTKTKFDALVVETDTYASLSFDAASPNFIKKVLGTETLAGSQPSLVHVLDADNPTKPKAKAYSLIGGGATKSKAPVDGDPSGTAFNLEAKKVGADGNNTTVTISNVVDASKTFSLVAVWSSPPITGIKLADLPAKLAAGGYEISVTDPSGGTTFTAIPAAGVVSLTGGAGAKLPSAASATVYAS